MTSTRTVESTLNPTEGVYLAVISSLFVPGVARRTGVTTFGLVPERVIAFVGVSADIHVVLAVTLTVGSGSEQFTLSV